MRRLLALIVAVSGTGVWAADFMTAGVDPGRTGWVKDEKVFTTSNVKDMKLLWKTKLDSTPREMHNLFPPIVLSSVTTSAGPKEIAVVAGISDDLWGIDTATGQEVWHKHFDSTYQPPAAGGPGGGQGGTLCPGGQTAAPTAGPGGTPGSYVVYAVSWDGRLRRVNAATGEDLVPPAKFMPPNAKPWSLNLVNEVIYTGISQGCGGVTFSFFSYDLKTNKASAFLPGGGGLWGRRGPAVTPESTVWMGTGDGYYEPEAGHLGNSLVAVKLDANQQLQPAGWYAPPNVNWLWHRDLDINVSPISIDFKGKHLLFGTSKECRIWMVDRDVVTNTTPGSSHQQMLDRSPLICNPGARYDAAGVWGSLAVWVQNNQLHLAVPFLGKLADTYDSPVQIGKPQLGGVAVLKIDDTKWKFVPEWTYGDIDQGDEAVYANGVLFVNAAGEDTYQVQAERAWNEPPRVQPPGGGRGSAVRIANSRRAAIYAFEAASGKLLWSSGDQITSWNHGSGMTAVNGKAYIGTFDGTLYCFGVPLAAK